MTGKVQDARETLAHTRARYSTKLAYLERRWGQNRAMMTSFKVIVQEQVEETWNKRKEKNKEKLKHLERKWKREKMKRMAGDREIGGKWKGINIGDKELEEEEVRRGEDGNKPALKYGGVVTTPEEESILKLPS